MEKAVRAGVGWEVEMVAREVGGRGEVMEGKAVEGCEGVRAGAGCEVVVVARGAAGWEVARGAAGCGVARAAEGSG